MPAQKLRTAARAAAHRGRAHFERTRTTGRVLALVILVGMALLTSGPGASAAQPSGVGNAHLVPQAATDEGYAYRPVADVLPRGDTPPPEDHDSGWLPLAILAGLLLAGGGGYLLRSRREAA
ncbi:LPXTG cell wall anchor domain-containing protein [Amycolatopsis rhabdoformis]|uniref:LPXTG cell wall anchor domain-containing protein n=1 Tax=Amycolatopsis rhabdoformis TaxID=1448059 RepID=A0ABZ1HYE3_9PSEU|nr:LPXTG cell wall anchor domain-containing protein [Amycolatopsis rhabdoformis]WSE26975.1 LPXTG cell wall anchor domain-containing protein [Amycolatopsis rhabdoformis]